MNTCIKTLKWGTNYYLASCKRISSLTLLRGNCTCASGNDNKNIKLDYVRLESATPNKPPIVICHGLFGNKKNWRALGKKLNTSCDREVVLVDAINHGSSPHSDAMSYIDMSEHLINLLDDLDIPKTALIGHSMGGKTVMTTALTYPTRIEKLVVVDAAPELSKSLGEIFCVSIGPKEV